MKSGKSLELIARVAPYAYADQKILYVQAAQNSRDNGITSRLGIDTQALRVTSLTEVTTDFDVIGIDEINMFPATDITVISRWLKLNKEVFISGLDLDYRATVPPIITAIYEQQPDVIIRKQAVCDVCKKINAGFTQILANGKPILSGLPLITPEDGTYDYQARCRDCFVRL